MEVLKRTKLRFLAQIISKILIKSLYTWKTSAQLTVPNRYQGFNVGKNYNQDIPNYKPVIAKRFGQNSKGPNFDSVFEELKASLIVKARPKKKHSDPQDWKTFIFGESGKEEISKKIIHKRSSTGDV